MKKEKTFFRLFITVFTLSAVTFGGGYVIVPLMRKKFAQELEWVPEEEMLEFVAISQSSPGAMVLNCATILGYRLFGFRGAVVAVCGTALPPLIILTVVSAVYNLIKDNVYVEALMRGMRAGIAAVIVDAVVGMAAEFFKKDRMPSLLVMAAAFSAAWFFKVNVAVIILSCAAVGAIATIISKKRGGGAAS